jgi:hypothetical protein
MSSVTRFIRQIPQSTTYYNAAGLITGSLTAGASGIYEFIPSSSNYVGNYPNGFNDTSGGFVAPCGQNLASALNQAYSTTTLGAGLVLRDMGKTIFAPIGTTTGQTFTAPTTTAPNPTWGYFRQVQLLLPGTITQGPGFMGGTTGNTFGVLGAANTPDIYTDYLTFYIPVSIGGITGAVVNTQAYALAGGQM